MANKAAQMLRDKPAPLLETPEEHLAANLLKVATAKLERMTPRERKKAIADIRAIANRKAGAASGKNR